MQNILIQLQSWAEVATERREAQGLEDLESLKSMTDMRIYRIFSVVYKPGDSTLISISEAAHEHLTLALLYVKHQDQTKRPVAVGDINLPVIQDLRDQRDLEDIDNNN